MYFTKIVILFISSFFFFFSCNSSTDYGESQIIWDFEETSSEGGDFDAAPANHSFEFGSKVVVGENIYNLLVVDDSILVNQITGKKNAAFKIQYPQNTGDVEIVVTAIQDTNVVQIYKYQWFVKYGVNSKMLLAHSETNSSSNFEYDLDINALPIYENPFQIILFVQKLGGEGSLVPYRQYQTFIYFDNF